MRSLVIRLSFLYQQLTAPHLTRSVSDWLRLCISLARNNKYIPKTRWLYIEVTSTCNLNCRFCAYPKVKSNLPRDILSTNDFVERINAATEAGITHFGLTPTVGDVFVDRHFIDKLAFLEQHRNVKAYRFTTNLILPSVEQLEYVLSAKKLDILGISIYGHTRRLFASFAKGNANAYRRLTDNLQIIHDATHLPNSINIGLRTEQAMPGYYPGQSQLVDLLLAIGVKHNKVNLSLNKWYDNWAGIITQDDVNDLGISVPPESQTPKYGPCNLLFHKNMVTVDGRILGCACRDVHGELEIGNIKNDKLADVLDPSTSKLATIISQQNSNRFNQVCHSCTAYKSIYDPG